MTVTFPDSITNDNVIERLAALELPPPSAVQTKGIQHIIENRDIVVTSSNLEADFRALMVPFIELLERSETPYLGLVIAGNDALSGSAETILRKLLGNSTLVTQHVSEDNRPTSVSSAKSGFLVGSAPALSSLIRDGAVSIEAIKTLVVFDVDEIFSAGGGDNLEFILRSLAHGCHNMVFTEQMPPQLAGFAQRYLKNTQFLSHDSTGSTHATFDHVYYELSGDVLAKPNALVDIMETTPVKSTVIFCASRSDGELVQAVLKKRGFRITKFTDETPRSLLPKLLQQFDDGELDVAVASDSVLGDLDVGRFEAVLNFSVHPDPEIYLARSKPLGNICKLKLAMTLVGPLDFSNFHFVRKVAGFEFTKLPLPSRESVKQAKISKLAREAVEGKYLNDESLATLVYQVIDSENKKELIALLLHKVLNVLPALESKDSPVSEAGPRGRGQDRSDRAPRGDQYEERGYRDSRPPRGRGGFDDRRGPRQDSESRFDSRQDQDDNAFRARGRDNRDNRRGGFEDREPRTPPARDVRLYVGHGLRHGFNLDQMNKILKTHSQCDDNTVKRFSVREMYSFVDIAEAEADKILSDIASARLDSGEQFFIRRATEIPVPRGESTEDGIEDRNGGGTHRDETADNEESFDGEGSDEEVAI